MVSWFRIRLDKAIGWVTHRQKHFLSNSLSLLLCYCLDLKARSIISALSACDVFFFKCLN